MSYTDKLAENLARRAANDLYRTRRVLNSPQGTEVNVDGRRMLSFCSNDYLGLASDPRIIDALKQGAETYGVGSGAAHLLSGHSIAHQELEYALAEFVGRPRALLFSTGYMANLGIITALLGRTDEIWEDRLNHASLIDGGLLSRARFRRYVHANVETLAESLTRRAATGMRLIATDGVFSMDGDIAPLPELATIATQHNAWLMVDDAHGLGVLGATGRGTLEHYGLKIEQVPILMGTLGKAFGVFGAFVAGDAVLIETLIQAARSFIYTTALPPALAMATLTSLRIVQTETWRREQLFEHIKQFRTYAAQLELPLLPSITPIQPLLVGSSNQALAWSRHLETHGILVPAIRYPTVPKNQSRLRITLSALHTAKQVENLIDKLSYYS
jgi:8-amino-7-oxononanoate synthase